MLQKMLFAANLTHCDILECEKGPLFCNKESLSLPLDHLLVVEVALFRDRKPATIFLSIDVLLAALFILEFATLLFLRVFRLTDCANGLTSTLKGS